MFIYVHWSKDGYNTAMAFHKLEKAADFILNHLKDYCGMEIIEKKKKLLDYDNDNDNDDNLRQPRIQQPSNVYVPKQETKKLTTLKDFLSKNDKSMQGLLHAIHLYEEYSQYTLCSKSLLHSFQEVQITE